MKFQVFTNKYSPCSKTSLSRRTSYLSGRPLGGPFAKTNGKSSALFTSCDLSSKNDQEPGKQGDVSAAGQGAALHRHLEDSVRNGARLSRRRPGDPGTSGTTRSSGGRKHQRKTAERDQALWKTSASGRRLCPCPCLRPLGTRSQHHALGLSGRRAVPRCP